MPSPNISISTAQNKPTRKQKPLTTHNRHNNQIHPLEIPHNLIQPNPEPTSLDFLCSSRPFHLDAEEMTQDGNEEMEGDAAEEEDEHRGPFCGFEDGFDEDLFAETVTEHGECEG
jgi:hypothetical protein